MTKAQIGILAVMALLTLGVFVAVAVLISQRDDKANNTALVSMQTLPAHKVTAVMRDPFNLTSDGSGSVWILIVPDDWRHFFEHEASLLIEHYTAQYSDANPLVIDFLCDYTFATEEAFLRAKDSEYSPHVLFGYTGPIRAGVGGELMRFARFKGPTENSIYGTACK